MDYAAAQGIIELPSPGNNPKSSADDAGQTRSLATDDLVTLNAALDAATAESIATQARLAAVGPQPDASGEALANRAIGVLREERADAASEYARLLVQATADDPAAKALRAKIDSLDSAIRSEENRIRTSLQQAYQAATTRKQALIKQVDTLKGSLVQLRQRSIQYNIYQRDADTNRELYDALLQRYKEIDVAGAVENNNVAVVDAAKLPDRPSSPPPGGQPAPVHPGRPDHRPHRRRCSGPVRRRGDRTRRTRAVAGGAPGTAADSMRNGQGRGHSAAGPARGTVVSRPPDLGRHGVGVAGDADLKFVDGAQEDEPSPGGGVTNDPEEGLGALGAEPRSDRRNGGR